MEAIHEATVTGGGGISIMVRALSVPPLSPCRAQEEDQDSREGDGGEAAVIRGESRQPDVGDPIAVSGASTR